MTRKKVYMVIESLLLSLIMLLTNNARLRVLFKKLRESFRKAPRKEVEDHA